MKPGKALHQENEKIRIYHFSRTRTSLILLYENGSDIALRGIERGTMCILDFDKLYLVIVV